jgi:hypothetical protein
VWANNYYYCRELRYVHAALGQLITETSTHKYRSGSCCIFQGQSTLHCPLPAPRLEWRSPMGHGRLSLYNLGLSKDRCCSIHLLTIQRTTPSVYCTSVGRASTSPIRQYVTPREARDGDLTSFSDLLLDEDTTMRQRVRSSWPLILPHNCKGH